LGFVGEPERVRPPGVGNNCRPGRRRPGLKSEPITVAEVALAFLEWAAGYYGTSSELDTYKLVIRTLRADYGSTPAVDFGPLALKTVRLRMVEANLCRKEINRRVRMVQPPE
jgi:hypothetical protein